MKKQNLDFDYIVMTSKVRNHFKILLISISNTSPCYKEHVRYQKENIFIVDQCLTSFE